jgi:hypothetical protein
MKTTAAALTSGPAKPSRPRRHAVTAASGASTSTSPQLHSQNHQKPPPGAIQPSRQRPKLELHD